MYINDLGGLLREGCNNGNIAVLGVAVIGDIDDGALDNKVADLRIADTSRTKLCSMRSFMTMNFPGRSGNR